MLGEKIKKHREEKKMTQVEVAEVLGLKPATISKYEAGTLNFTPSSSLELLKKQKSFMGSYINSLEIRAEIEGINLFESEK